MEKPLSNEALGPLHQLVLAEVKPRRPVKVSKPVKEPVTPKKDVKPKSVK